MAHLMGCSLYNCALNLLSYTCDLFLMHTVTVCMIRCISNILSVGIIALGRIFIIMLDGHLCCTNMIVCPRILFNTVVVVVPECTKYIRACNTRTHVHIQDAFVITMANIVCVVISCLLVKLRLVEFLL